mmetsp:Transcript_553/g.1249  ORF Transcript_553/g.1249 Transcript_553/m.1249 type:complete len:205 (-) Transcript_553:344-958(-)
MATSWRACRVDAAVRSTPSRYCGTLHTPSAPRRAAHTSWLAVRTATHNSPRHSATRSPIGSGDERGLDGATSAAVVKLFCATWYTHVRTAALEDDTAVSAKQRRAVGAYESHTAATADSWPAPSGSPLTKRCCRVVMIPLRQTWAYAPTLPACGVWYAPAMSTTLEPMNAAASKCTARSVGTSVLNATAVDDSAWPRSDLYALA